MVNIKFEAYKIKRELKRSGAQYEFKRYKENEYKEPTNESVSVGFIKGIYHEQNGSIQITAGDATQTRTKKIPMILCLYEDVASLNLKPGDFVKINSRTLKLTGIVNIQEWSIVADISLEVVDDGN